MIATAVLPLIFPVDASLPVTVAVYVAVTESELPVGSVIEMVST